MNSFEQIKIPESLDTVIKNTVKTAHKDKKKKIIKANIIKYNTAAILLIALFTLSINFIPAFAVSLKNIPGVSSIVNVLQFHYDKNVASAARQGESQNVNEKITDKNISITINNILSDNGDLFIVYTLNGKNSSASLKNILLNGFVISDSNNKPLVSSEDFKPIIIPEKLNGYNGDFILLNNGNYKCIVSSLGDTIDSYSKNGETKGSIELTGINNNKIPDQINLKISGLTEAYSNTPSKKTYDNFISTFGRNPMNIQGNWDFNLKINKSSRKVETYSNVNFSADNTSFNIKYFKIYPVHSELKIKLGQNTIDKSQCRCIGGILDTENNNSYAPYIIDDNGNKYMISGRTHVEIDSENCVDLTFESSYFNKSKHLYLVISQLKYSPGKPYVNIEPVKIKIK